jgi:rhodanese-related sulfurtransferase
MTARHLLGLVLLMGAGCQGGGGDDGSLVERGMARLIGVGTIDARPARELMRRGGAGAPVLLDTRDADAFKEGHIPGSVSLALDQIDGYLAHTRPSKNRPVIAVCYSGHASQVVAAIAAAHGYERAYSLAGGIERWRELGFQVERGAPEARKPGPLRPPVVRGSWFEQLAETISGLVVKPIYMLFSLLIILALRGRKARDLTLIRQGMIAFLVGESICALNFLFTAGASETLELLHGAGMVVMGALVTWGLYLLLDERVLRFADPEARCMLQRFCGRCWKRDPVSCGLQRLFLLLAPALALVALMPLSTPLRPLHIILPVFDSDVVWHKSVTILLIELRLYPALAVLHFAWTTRRLAGDKTAILKAQSPFFWGFGFLSFALMRYFLFAAYRAMPIWADFWEEITEFIAVAAVGLLLWVFRRQLDLVRVGAGEAKEQDVGAG